jgi:hypothetical protein
MNKADCNYFVTELARKALQRLVPTLERSSDQSVGRKRPLVEAQREDD